MPYLPAELGFAVLLSPFVAVKEHRDVPQIPSGAWKQLFHNLPELSSGGVCDLGSSRWTSQLPFCPPQQESGPEPSSGRIFLWGVSSLVFPCPTSPLFQSLYAAPGSGSRRWGCLRVHHQLFLLSLLLWCFWNLPPHFTAVEQRPWGLVVVLGTGIEPRGA